MPIKFNSEAWDSLTSLKSKTRYQCLKSLPEDLCSGILRPEKSIDLSRFLNPWNLGSRGEHVTPRPPRPTIRPLIPLQKNIRSSSWKKYCKWFVSFCKYNNSSILPENRIHSYNLKSENWAFLFFLSFFLSLFLSIFIYLLFICLFICLFIHLFIIYLFIFFPRL